MRTIFFVSAILFLLPQWGCYRETNLSDIPTLAFMGISKDTLKQGFSREDSVIFYFELTDGDGDIGYEESDTLSNSVEVTDMRTGNLAEQFRIPIVPFNVVSKGLQAEMQLTLFTTCCLFPNNIPPCSDPDEFPYDTLIYQFRIRDRAGHVSDPVLSPPIILICD